MALIRKINGKLYHFSSFHYRKPDAQARASKLRKQGISARVIRNKADGIWEIWRR